MATEPDTGALFMAATGGALGLDEITRVVGRYVRKSGVANAGSCHAFRHAMATATLGNDADLRCIQEILGHQKLDTTQVYTRLSIERLKQVHAAIHPAAKLTPRTQGEAAPERPEP